MLLQWMEEILTFKIIIQNCFPISYCNYDVVEILLEHVVPASTSLLELDSKTSLNFEMTRNLLAILTLFKRKGFLMRNTYCHDIFNGFNENQVISSLSGEI